MPSNDPVASKTRENLVRANTQPRKIIVFDSWTEGVANIERLVPAFRERGLELVLVHIGSWGHDLARPPEEYIGNVLVRDVRYYQGLSFREILGRERPAAVLFLSIQAFAHRAFNRYCRQLGIPTLHLYHGVVGVQSTASKRLNPINLKSQLALALSRFAKSLFRLWPIYAKALWQTNAPLKDWFWFGYDVWRQVSGYAYSGVAAPDASTTACCVYTPGDVPHAAQRYRLRTDAIFVVGNPDLAKFGMKESDIGACLYRARETTKEIVYVDTALIEAGAVFDNAEDFVRHLRTTKAELEIQGLQLVVKLHPAHYRTGVIDLLRECKIELCPNDGFVSRLKSAGAAIVEPSSAALIPALLGLPVFLARYGKLSGQEYGEVLVEYPRGCELGAIKELTSRLEDIATVRCADSVHAWIIANAGPLPADRMPARVADVVQSIVNEPTPQSFIRMGCSA